MRDTVGVAELRQNLSKHLRRIATGERLVVTDRHRPVATLGPPPGAESALERLVAEGRLTRPTLADDRFSPVRLPDGADRPATRALQAARADRR